MAFFDVRSVIKEVPDANIYMFIGERSNGKTYSALSYCMDQYVANESRFVYVRRLEESLRAKYMRNLFTGNAKTGDVTNHMKQLGFEGIMYYSGAFWPTIINDKDKVIRHTEPCGYTQAVSTWETGKGGSIPKCGTILFDEFLTRQTYFPNEPIMFENLISSLARNESNAKVIMLANTVTWTCPYFREWGLNHVREMKQGTYDIYGSGDGKRKIVVCYTEHSGPKASDVYFNYDNPRSRMITTGVWETAEYPQVPTQVGDWYMGEPCYIHSIEGWSAKIVPFQTKDGMEGIIVWDNVRELIGPEGVDKRYADRVIYTDYFFPYLNCRMAMTKHTDNLTKYILKALRDGRVFYQNNTVGENIRNYLKWSTAYTPIPN